MDDRRHQELMDQVRAARAEAGIDEMAELRNIAAMEGRIAASLGDGVIAAQRELEDERNMAHFQDRFEDTDSEERRELGGYLAHTLYANDTLDVLNHGVLGQMMADAVLLSEWLEGIKKGHHELLTVIDALAKDNEAVRSENRELRRMLLDAGILRAEVEEPAEGFDLEDPALQARLDILEEPLDLLDPEIQARLALARRDANVDPERCCPGDGTLTHVRGCVNHPEEQA